MGLLFAIILTEMMSYFFHESESQTIKKYLLIHFI